MEQPGNQVAAGVDWALRGDAAVRAITAYHFGWPPARTAAQVDEWAPPVWAELLVDEYLPRCERWPVRLSSLRPWGMDLSLTSPKGGTLGETWEKPSQSDGAKRLRKRRHTTPRLMT